MASFSLQNISITGMACAVPRDVKVTTEYYSQFGQKDVDSFIEMTGVKETHRTREE